ncbi:MAG TPA: Hsp33 family molecular chaperone HslO [Steroidobacteraceae bacterium]|jgi:molecular chaperone Hsp33|nr:Hsp33 family molecular chaperone HslO [Steroidobacteraceae bacterium]
MTTEFRAPEQVQRFVFDGRPVRGQWVGIGQGWRDLRQFREYSPPVQELLGQAVCASLLLASTLKFKGTLTLQLQGNGAVSLLVAQCTHDFRYRALARAQGDGAATSLTPEVFRWLVGEEGRLTVTIEADERELRYQGVVPLTGHSLAACLETYFASSEQLPTRVRLAADANSAAGLLVQRLPGVGGSSAESADDEADSAWGDAQASLEAVTAADLLHFTGEELLMQDFRGHDVRIFAGVPAKFECRCDHERVDSMLRSLGQEEVREVLKAQGAVTVTCDFCNRPYEYDAAAVDALFAQDDSSREPGRGSGQALH